nr:RDD family protein [uncultured Carboxylicivirga sp.]
MEHLQISTTQNVDIDFQLASVGDRLLAHIIDGFIKASYALILGILIIQLVEAPEWWYSILALPVIFYNLLCNMFLNGQTFGKMIMKIRVVKQDGSELNFGACFIRWIFRIVDFHLTYGLGALLTIVINGKGKRIGDLAAGTVVLKIDAKGDLNDTAYVEVEEGYSPVYPEVIKLHEKDMQTIKEVLNLANKNNSYSNIGAPHPLALKTKEVVSKKMNVDSKMPAIEFLNTILKDYNYYNQ